MAAAAILEKFQMAISPQPVVYLRNGSRSTYIARVIFAIAQLSCHIYVHCPILCVVSFDQPINRQTCVFVFQVYNDNLRD